MGLMPANYNCWGRAPSLSESWYCRLVTPSGLARLDQHRDAALPCVFYTHSGPQLRLPKPYILALHYTKVRGT